ncbi:MAG: choice-of-anchor X domain-containing protein [Bacteroidota bacterium]
MVINPYPGRRATIRVRIEDELSNGIQATATVTQDGQSQAIPLWDDGLHGDGVAGDGMYGAYVTLNAVAQFIFDTNANGSTPSGVRVDDHGPVHNGR